MKTFYNLRAFFLVKKNLARLAPRLAVLFIIAWPSAKLLAQAPAISYSSPHIYLSGAAISPLSPGNSGGAAAAPAYSANPTTLASGVAAVGVAVDAPGNIYFADVSKGMVYKIPAGGGPTVTIASGFQDIAGVTVDAAGNVYFCSVTEGNVYKIAGDGSVTTIGSGFSNPKGLAADAAGNVYVGDITPGVVTELPATGGSAITIASGFGAVEGIGLDGQGNVYVLDEFAHHVVEVPANGGGQVIIASGFIEAQSLAVNFAGDVYVYDGDVGDLWMIPAGGSKSIISFNDAKFMAVDGAGNLYLSIPDGTLGELSPIGGYYINKALPAGLSFSASTGTISGTPTALSNATNYTVTAFNAAGSGTATVNITVGVPPSVGYSTPHSYNTGTAITPLAPLSSRVAAWGYSSSAGSMGLGTIVPQDVAADAAGNVYVADLITNHIIKIPAGNGTPVVLAAFTSPFGLAADAAGNVYVASASAGAILEIPAGGGTVNPIGSGFSAPSAVAVDGSGNVYVADAGNGALKEVPAGNGTPVTIQSGFANIQGVTVDGSGNIYVADAGTSGNGAVYKILPGGGGMSATGTGFSSPGGVAVDAAGNLYVSDINKSVITVIEPDGTQFTIGSGFNQPGGLALDGSGNLYIADSANGAVKEIKPTGGYFLSPFLPAGLTFNNSTGIISGTPIAASPAANYTVTAYNSTGSGTATVNITTPLSPPPVISYSTPQTYMLANAITPLSPVNTGGAVAALGFNPAATPVSTGISDALCMAKDKLGNLYIGEGSGQVSVLPAGGSAASVFATGFGPVYSIAVDASNNVYVGDSAHLWKIPAGGGTPVTLGSLSSPVGIAFDAAGNLYVADNSGSDEGVYKMAPDGTGQTRIDNGIPGPGFIAFDANGNLFIADQPTGSLYEVPVFGPQKQVASGFSLPVSLTTDPSGNVYVSDENSIYCYSAVTGFINFAPVSTYGLMADANFNLYYASFNDGMIYKISPHGGYFTSPELPPGLTINPNSGIINGTPLMASAATNYSVTGFNGPVSSTATVNIAVGLPPPPVIKYSTPQIYTVAKAITPLSPVSTGGTVAGPAFNTVTTNLSTGFFDATCMARDQAGNIYIGESTGRVSVLHPGSNGASVFATGFSTRSIRSIAADAPGNVYAADGASVWKIPAGGGAAVKLGSFVNPVGLASDPAGNIYVADNDPGNGGAYKITPGGTIQQIDITATSEIAPGMNGDIFLGFGFREILEEGAPFDVVLNDITAFTMDPIGNIYLADLSSGITTLYLLPATGSGKVAVGPHFSGSNVTGLMAGPDLSLYAVVNGGILKMNATGGYFSPGLPPGLILDPTTGAITGTPAAALPAANYTVTAFNNGVSGSATVNITVNLPPPPVISYSTPQTYTTGTAITPLQPLNTGSPVTGLGFNPVATTLNTGFSDAACLAMDKSGNIYIGESSGKVSVLPPGSGPATVFASGFGPVAGIAIDASGNVYVADGSSSIRKIPAGGGTPVSLGSFSRPAGVALDAPGNIYVADAGGHGVYKMAADGTGQTKITDGSVFNPGSVALDANGNVFVVDEDLNSLFEIPAGGAEKTINGAGMAVSVTTDASGNIYVGSGIGAGLFFITASQSVSGTIGSSLRGIVTAVMVDPNFNLYAVDGGAISKINAASGYFVSPELPAGLTIDPNSGAIGGTPAAALPAANYTVTAFNNGVSGSATVNITVNLPPPPVISYSTPQTYTTGTAITPLQPLNTGSPVTGLGFNPVATTLNTGFSDAACLAMDKSGNIYIGESSGKVSVLPPGSGPATVFASGFGPVAGIAVDAAGNVYVADGSSSIRKIPAGGGTPVSLGSFSRPAGVALDAPGNIYVADAGGHGVYKMAADGTGQTKITDGSVFNPGSVALDANGNVFVVDEDLGALFEIPAGGAEKTINGYNSAVSVTTDPSGNIYVGSGSGNGLFFITASQSVSGTIGSSLRGIVTAVMVDPNFNLYAVDGGAISKINAASGYFVNPELPAGLTIDPNSGAISGTPSAVSPAANYTVTAFSNSVSGAATVNITVNPSAPTISYNTPQVYVQNTAISPLNPVSANVATPGYLSTTTTAGSFAQPFATAVDQSGNVYVADKSANSISELLPGGGQVTIGTGLNTPAAVAVDKSGNVYTANQGDNTVVEIQAHTGTQTFIGSGYHRPTAVAVDSAGNVFVADVQGSAGVVYKISPGQSKRLFKGGFVSPNGIAVDATGNVYVSDFGGGATASMVYKISPDGSTETPVNHSFSTATGVAIDATGNLFIVDAGNTDIVEYPAGGGSAITITAGLTFPFGISADGAGNLYVADPGAGKVVELKPEGGYFINRALPAGLSLNATAGIISGTPTKASPATNYMVTAYSSVGSGTATVNITVTPNNANLAGLTASNSRLAPVFTPANTSYQLKVGNIDFLTLTPASADPGAAITVNSTTVVSGAVSQHIPLVIGSNQVQIVVTASDHVTQKTYTIAITRVPSANANLSNLRISNTRLSPAFNKDTTSYTASVGLNTISVIATPVAAHATTAIMVNGQPVASGNGSDPIILPIGLDTITTVVTAQDSITTKTYTIVINHQSANANIIAVRLSKGALSPAFRQADTSYTAEVDNSVSSITVKPVTSDTSATVTVNGIPVVSRTASPPIALNIGQDTITVTGLAANGINTKTYTIIVTRDMAPVNSLYQPISVVNPANNPQLTDEIRVHQGVSPNGDGMNDVLVIDGITAYPDNKLSIMSRNGELVFEATGYDNSSRAFDGHSNKNGKMQSPGTYFYSLDYKVGEVIKHKTGFIVLKW